MRPDTTTVSRTRGYRERRQHRGKQPDRAPPLALHRARRPAVRLRPQHRLDQEQQRPDQDRRHQQRDHRSGRDRRQFQVETTGIDPNNTSRWESGPWRAALTVGGDAFRDEVTVLDPSGTGDFFTPNGQRTVSGASRNCGRTTRPGSSSSPPPATTTIACKAPTASAAAAATGSHPRPRSASRRSSGSRSTAPMPKATAHRRSPKSSSTVRIRAGAVHAAVQHRPQAGNRQDQGNRHQYQVRRPVRRQRCAAHQGQRLPERRHRFHRADRAGERSAGAGRSHLHDAGVRLRPVSEHSVGAHPWRGVRRQL